MVSESLMDYYDIADHLQFPSIYRYYTGRDEVTKHFAIVCPGSR